LILRAWSPILFVCRAVSRKRQFFASLPLGGILFA